MANNYFKKRRKYRKKDNIFNPDRDYIKKAVEEYISSGKEINIVVLDDESYEKFMSLQSDNSILDL